MGFWAAAAGSALGAGLDYFSAKQQNDMATGNAREAMRFSDAQSAKQMAFQERMSNTSHQREVDDLRAAGLNPLLSLNSGSSTPAGSMGTGVNAPVVPELGAAVGSVRQSLALKSQLATEKRQRINLDTDTNVKDAEWRNRELGGQGLKLENEIMAMRNKLFRENPNLFKLHAMSGVVSSVGSFLGNAGSASRNFKLLSK